MSTNLKNETNLKKNVTNGAGKNLSECTTIIVGEKQTADGSRILARSEDFDALRTKNFIVREDTNNGPEEFVAADSPFHCPLPKEALGYTGMPDYQYHNE